MVKFVSVILAVAIFAGCAIAGVDEDLIALVMKAIITSKKCKASTHITDAELAKIEKDHILTYKAGCYISCFATEFGVVNADNKFDKEKIHKILEPIRALAKKEKKEDIYNSIIIEVDSCLDAQTGGSDPCEVGKKFGECMNAYSKLEAPILLKLANKMDAAMKIGIL